MESALSGSCALAIRALAGASGPVLYTVNVHCTLYTLYTVHYTHCTLFTLHTVHCTLCTLYTVTLKQCTVEIRHSVLSRRLRWLAHEKSIIMKVQSSKSLEEIAEFPYLKEHADWVCKLCWHFYFLYRMLWFLINKSKLFPQLFSLFPCRQFS